ncbi:MAG: bifunctional (p)ppGpp synthetase/guanosine-3',5'-bis(diphosphate) 3'-pyrophosphohydrolase [Chloroflexi bacterium]|nr:bifunctional (p)ppGpp synthetase/guanosine-3',5'-bis(diphosphate) 3'-pyrophosphohydrolase [Chloroflexota bacterium]MDA1146626.1 bifunctional (p)ppGpp synthetase/guanosine-3',5'-bis(diphosphate) 3'-pyrophosphohydrolase [Chloroflexota bacterium]
MASDARDLLAALETYLPADRVSAISEALEFSIAAHAGQTRRSGEPYVTHPIAVSSMLADLRMDALTIEAGLLHDVVEDCDVSVEELSERFGAEVGRLVEGATKIEHLPTMDPLHADAETLRKMFLAMAEDVRVVIIKLADRLHNMRTLQHLAADRQRVIAQETRDIYAPLAGRLGVWQFKWELEDLAFRFLEPEQYRRVASTLASKRSERERYIRRVETELRDALDEVGITAEVTGRAKHLYSIYEKEQRYTREGKTFDQIHDLLALRVLVDNVSDCYAALGVVHQTWRPIPSSFDDYIASPKESLYQSLHTSVLGPGTRPFEVQIRTFEMHEVAEYGVAAHWQYKSEPGKRDVQYEERMSWLRHLIEWQQEGAEDFLESVKTDVFADQVFVNTPRGDVHVLPRGCTPIDFAYRVHTDLGHACAGSKVNGRLVPLNTKLQNGDVVEILRSRTQKGPSRDWMMPGLGYLGSSHTRQKVRQWFRRQLRGENVERGKEQLEREMKRLAIDRVPINMWERFKLASMEDLYSAIGSGDVSSQHLGNVLAEHAPVTPPSEFAPSTIKVGGTPGVRVLGTAGLHVVLAKCCSPLPGDPIVGFTTRGGGVTVHRGTCGNIARALEPERLLDCDWGPREDTYAARVEVHAWDRVGLLRDVSTLAANAGVNMVGVRTQEHDDRTTTLHLTLETEGGAQFMHLISALDAVRGVISVDRALQ